MSSKVVHIFNIRSKNIPLDDINLCKARFLVVAVINENQCGIGNEEDCPNSQVLGIHIPLVIIIKGWN